MTTTWTITETAERKLRPGTRVTIVDSGLRDGQGNDPLRGASALFLGVATGSVRPLVCPFLVQVLESKTGELGNIGTWYVPAIDLED